jgi:hypothetical protein
MLNSKSNAHQMKHEERLTCIWSMNYIFHVIVFPMHNYNHDVGFHVGIKGKASHGGLAS